MEDYFTLKNIIIQGLKLGYKEKEVKGNISGLDMHNGNWRLSSGVELGSSWDIILSLDFASALWGVEGVLKLQDMVIMNSQDRLNYLKDYINKDAIEGVEDLVVEYETPSDGLMTVIRESLIRIKGYSSGLYKDSCQDTYDNLKNIVSKESVTQLNAKDFIILNATHQVMNDALVQYLIDNGRESFAICPECGCRGFNHTQGCSIEIKTRDWLMGQNEGC